MAPKVTGMILDLEQADFTLTLNNFEIFKTKVLEAAQMLTKISAPHSTMIQGGAAVEAVRGRVAGSSSSGYGNTQLESSIA